MKKVAIGIILVLSLLISCSSGPGMMESGSPGKVIKPETKIEDPKVICLRDELKKIPWFKPEFKYDDSYPPSIYVYITGDWNNLSDMKQEDELYRLGVKWYLCNPDNNAPITIIAYDVNNIPLKAKFVSKGE